MPITKEDVLEKLEVASKKTIKDTIAHYSEEYLFKSITESAGLSFNMVLHVDRCNFFMKTTSFGKPMFTLRMDVPVETLKTITKELEDRSGIDSIYNKHGGTTLFINDDEVKPFTAKSANYGNGSGYVGLVMSVKKNANGTTYFNATVKIAVLDMGSSVASMSNTEFLDNFVYVSKCLDLKEPTKQEIVIDNYDDAVTYFKKSLNDLQIWSRKYQILLQQ